YFSLRADQAIYHPLGVVDHRSLLLPVHRVDAADDVEYELAAARTTATVATERLAHWCLQLGDARVAHPGSHGCHHGISLWRADEHVYGYAKPRHGRDRESHYVRRDCGGAGRPRDFGHLGSCQGRARWADGREF